MEGQKATDNSNDPSDRYDVFGGPSRGNVGAPTIFITT